MIIVGLTGGIGSGKSAVSEMFQQLGARLIDYDVLAREVVEPSTKAWHQIVDTFGQDVLNDDTTINREKLAGIVFDNPEKLQQLNQIVHPAVFDEADRRVERMREADQHAIVIKDIPLLIETGVQKNKVDTVLVVYTNMENRLNRLVERGLNENDARKRIASQMPLEEKVALADFVIHNDGSFDETRRQVEEIHTSLRDGSALLSDH